MYKLLIVDDEQKIREVIREYAEFNGFETDEIPKDSVVLIPVV